MSRTLPALTVLLFAVLLPVRPILAGEKPLASLPAEAHASGLVVSATIDGKGPVRLVVDTGQRETLLTPSAARTLGLEGDPARLEGLRGTRPVLAARIATIELAPGVVLSDLPPALIVDLGGEPDGETGPDGVLGNTLFERFCVRLNFPEARVDLFERKAPPKLRGNCGRDYWVLLEVPTPLGRIVPAVVGGSVLYGFEVRPGIPGSALVARSVAKTLGLVQEETPTVPATLLGESFEAELTRVDRIELGDLILRDLPALLPADPLDLAVPSRMREFGVLGAASLRPFRLTFDRARSRIVVELPGSGPPPPYTSALPTPGIAPARHPLNDSPPIPHQHGTLMGGPVDPLLIPVHIGEKGPYLFELDSGADVTAIDVGLAEELGLEPGGDSSVEGIGGTVQGKRVLLRELRLGQIVIRNTSATIIELGYPDSRGIVGADLLEFCAVSINFPHREILIYDGQEFWLTPTPLPDCRERTVLDLDRTTKTPMAMCLYDGRIHSPVLVDTGDASYPFTPRDVAGYLGDLPDTSPRLLLSGIGGSFQVRIGRARSLDLGGFRITDPLLAVPVESEGDVGPLFGTLGRTLLADCRVTFDLAHRRVILERLWWPPSTSGQALLSPGILVSEEKETGEPAAVTGFLPGSRAEEAGLRTGDLILTVDGESTLDLPPAKVLNRLARLRTKEPVRLRIRRGEEEMEVAVECRDFVRRFGEE